MKLNYKVEYIKIDIHKERAADKISFNPYVCIYFADSNDKKIGYGVQLLNQIDSRKIEDKIYRTPVNIYSYGVADIEKVIIKEIPIITNGIMLALAYIGMSKKDISREIRKIGIGIDEHLTKRGVAVPVFDFD